LCHHGNARLDPWKHSNIVIRITHRVRAGAFPPHHPFDYLYNYGVRHLLAKPKLPPRTKQGRFACGIASGWLVIVIYLLSNNQVVLGNIFGATLIAVGTLVTTTDICIPSIIYNALFLKKEGKES
jgi:hypothetical protein